MRVAVTCAAHASPACSGVRALGAALSATPAPSSRASRVGAVVGAPTARGAAAAQAAAHCSAAAADGVVTGS
eukprot:6305887-Prymnesium_polylepis.1